MDNHLDYEGFRAQYEKQHPASVPQLEIEGSPYPRWLKLATFAMFLAAALLSAVHTIPVVFESIPESVIISPEVRTFAANGSVVAFELGLLLSAFLMVSKSSLRLAWILMGTMFAGTLVANIYSISQTKTADVGAIIVTIIFGAGIPIIALSAGKLYVNIYTAEAGIERRSREVYREALKQWDATILGAFTKYQKEIEKRVEKVSIPQQTQTDSRQSGMGYNRVSSAVDLALDYLRNNPNAVDMSVRDLGAVAGVGKDSAAKARSQYLSENGNGNGHM